jgi:hypothetical protein
MHKSATKCNETSGKWCKNKHGASKIIDTFETYQLLPSTLLAAETAALPLHSSHLKLPPLQAFPTPIDAPKMT